MDREVEEGTAGLVACASGCLPSQKPHSAMVLELRRFLDVHVRPRGERQCVGRAEEAAGQVTCCSSSSPCPGHQASLLGNGDVTLVSTPRSFPNLCYKIIKSRVGKFCLCLDLYLCLQGQKSLILEKTKSALPWPWK